MNGWYGLTWEEPQPKSSVVFLDVTLTLQNNKIHSNLYEKKLNMHLYIPPRSAHPPGVIKGLISGHIYRAYALCTDEIDAKKSVQDLFKHLRACGYNKL